VTRVGAVLPQAQDAVRVLGLEVARARRVRRWSQAELAERAGVSRETVRKVEHGGHRVTCRSSCAAVRTGWRCCRPECGRARTSSSTMSSDGRAP
jgi:DNA-binding XRE family transcriptional regulator